MIYEIHSMPGQSKPQKMKLPADRPLMFGPKVEAGWLKYTSEKIFIYVFGNFKIKRDDKYYWINPR